MKLVADANVLFSCLIKDGLTRRIWNHPSITLHAPEFIHVELKKYGPMLQEKSALKDALFISLVERITSILHFVPEVETDPYMSAAAVLSKDRKDWPYLACALHLNAGVLSNDADFKAQRRVAVFSTSELADKIGRL